MEEDTFFYIYFILFSMYRCFGCIYRPMHDLHACCLPRPGEGIGSLELELQTVVNHHVGAGK